jgi:hypothetical protein
VYCTAIGALFALACAAKTPETNGQGRHQRETWLAAACFLAVLSTYSMSNGLLVWPLLLGMSFWMRSPVRYRIVLGAGMVAMSTAYLWGYHSPGHHANPVDSFFHHLPQVLTFAATFLGSPADPLVSLLMRGFGLAGDATRVVWCAIFGYAGVAAFLACLFTIRRTRQAIRPAQVALCCTALFIMATSFLVGLGRVNFPLGDALVSRYATPAMIFWLALILFAWSLFGTDSPDAHGRRRLLAYAGLLLFMVAGIAAEQPDWIRFSKGYASGIADFESVVVSGVDDAGLLRSSYHTPAALFEVFDYLKNSRLSVFTEDWTHWTGTRLTDHFALDTQNSCLGNFDEVVFLPSALRPGSKASGWAWDKKNARAPQTIILADKSGRIVGVTRKTFERGDVAVSLPVTRALPVGWRGYVVPTGADPVTAYLLESDGRSVCPVGSLPTRQQTQEAAFSELLAPIVAPVGIEGAWTKDGYNQEAGQPPFDGPVYASWSGRDANTGTLHLGPFSVSNQIAIAIPVVSGPENGGLLVKAVNAKTGALIAAMAPPPVRRQWWVWRVDLPTAQPDLTVNIVAEDRGRNWGQWEALGMPHLLKNCALSPLANSNNSGQEVPWNVVGAAVEGGTPAIDGFWAKDGYNPEPGRPPVDGPTYGSWAGRDSHTGTIRMGPFNIHGQQSIAIPVVTGPSNAGMEIKIVDISNGEILASLSPTPRRTKWWAWKVALPSDRPGLRITVSAQDNGTAWGQWQALGVPHLLK